MLTRLYSSRLSRLNRTQSGFTLIELLVVVVIIGLLAAIALPIFINQQRAAVDASIKSDVRNTVSDVQGWVVNHPRTAFNNTKDYLAAGGRITKSKDSTVLGVTVAADGTYTACAFNDGGGNYRTAEKSWSFTSATGKFTQAISSCAGAVDAAGHDVSVTPQAPKFASDGSLEAGTEAAPYSEAVFADATPDATYSLATGSSLPNDLKLDPASGAITGTAVVSGDYEFTIVASNFAGSAQRRFSMHLAPSTIAPTWDTPASVTALPAAQAGEKYAGYTFTASGKPNPTFSSSDLTAKTGLMLSPDGIVSGTPTKSGDVTFTATAQNSRSSVDRQFAIHIDAAASVTITTASLPSAYVNIPYDSGNIAASTVATTGTNAFTITGLPAWASYSTTTGKITGTPTATGSVTATVKVKNGTAVDSKDFTFAVATAVSPTFTTVSTLAATVGASYSRPLLGTVGSPAATYSATGLPEGLTIDSATGEIKGTISDGVTNAVSFATDYNSSPASYVGRSTYTVKVTAKGATTVAKTYTFTINGQMIASGSSATSNGWVSASGYSLTNGNGVTVGQTDLYRDVSGLQVGAKYLVFANINQGCGAATIKVIEGGATTNSFSRAGGSTACSYTPTYYTYTAKSTTARFEYIDSSLVTIYGWSLTKMGTP